MGDFDNNVNPPFEEISGAYTRTGWLGVEDYLFDVLVTPGHVKIWADGALEFEAVGARPGDVG